MRLPYRMLLAATLASGMTTAAWAQDAAPPPSAPPPAAKEVPMAPGADGKQVNQKKVKVDEPEIAATEPGAQIGIGGRVRFIWLPTALLNLFVDHSTPMTSISFGGEVIRRKGNLDLVFGLEYAKLSAKNGLWLDKGKDILGIGNVDYLTFDDFGMISIDGSFIWHAELTDFMQLRYGVGLGVGILLGKIPKYRTSCFSNVGQASQLDDPSACPKTTEGEAPYANVNTPPVVPIVNLLLGLRFKIVESFSANLELGFRDVIFGGLSLGYFF